MILQLSNKYQKVTASLMLTICFNGMILPTYALNNRRKETGKDFYYSTSPYVRKHEDKRPEMTGVTNNKTKIENSVKAINTVNKINKGNIGGPSQPEMSAFKSIGTDNMVNLFTGDFSYNIPLLDVGGYPVNIFYDGGVSMEQEASWVGLGWNINPGNVNRNMRGIPDDFNGEDVLKQTQTMKPNVTWGVNLGADVELVGIKALKDIFAGSIGGNIGVSFNNYLGPALDIGIRGSTNYSIGGKNLLEKGAPTLGGSLSINASSRSGVTFSPSISLGAKAFAQDKQTSLGFGLKGGTSYNSRSGIKAIQISEQMSFNYRTLKFYEGKNGIQYSERMSSMNGNIASSSISFNKPSYIPAMRMPITNTAFSGHFQAGGGIFGVAVDGEIEVYKQKSKVADADVLQTKPMVGYLYLQKATNNANALMDFTRVNDNEVTPSTPVISAPQYSYDVFSIQGEGTGGSIRAYRNDEGYVRDNYSRSQDESFSLGGDIDVPGHYGGNFSSIQTPTTVGEWNSGNKLRSAVSGFTDANNSWENVYFRNPGETSVLNPNQYDRVGGVDLVRYKLGGTNMSPTIEPVLEKFSKDGKANGSVNISSTNQITERKKRTQVISFLNAEEASVIGLDKTIKNYDGNTILDNQNNLVYQSLPRFDNVIRKKHHISQINVTEANGQRYVYGIPVYNIKQKDFTFTVNNDESNTDPDKVDFSTAPTNEATTLNTGDKDGYLQITETPAYAHSFLLSGLLSPDYVDVTGNGITEDDLGNAVKFNYSEMAEVSKWRTPLTSDSKANFNAGKRTEKKDDKGLISYGERESWYLHSIESKTMIALFKLENRDDGKGAANEYGGINGSDNSAKRLKQIDLYSKADLKKNGLQGAKPIKTVHFEYNNILCKGTPNNTSISHGKLTLQKIYFTFNGQTRASKNQYVFSYGNTSDASENPGYTFNGSDRWGTYKPSSLNPQSLKNSDYPYSIQDKNLKSTIDKNASVWMLKKILLPSGGQMEVTYESDDYAFVQNKRAAIMMQVAGFGTNATTITNQLYNLNGNGISENSYVFIQVPEACASAQEAYQKYLSGIQQLSFKLAVEMPKGIEYLNSYAIIDGNNYGLYTADATNKTIWVKLKLVDQISPLSLTAIEFLREQLPGQAYPGYDLSESSGLAQIGDVLVSWLDNLSGAFKEPVKYLRQQGLAQIIDASKCFVRLNDPDGFKYGGGYRVKSVRLKDNWKQMNGGQLYTSEYGQNYDYTTKEIFNGVERTISSGVASYEPSLGGDENPFQTMVQVSNKVPLGPTSYGAIEMPVLDAFFPAASVGYSRVTVTSIKKLPAGGQDPQNKSRSGIGKQVTEFYTAKDFPVYYSNTSIDPSSDKQATTSSFGLFFYKYAFDSRALSQGFLVETNDMHGKLKSQTSYAENDDKTPINYTQNFYRNTGGGGMNEKFDFVYANQGGDISQGNMGVDVELMTDTREFSVKSNSLEIQAQVDLFPVFLPFWLPFVWPVVGNSENTYRAVTTTKVINYHSILDSVVVIDKGSQVSTKNLVFDSETGDVIVNRTNNEFNQPVYNTNYPAWWAYSGMGLAYKNIDAVYTGVNFRDGKIVSGNVPSSVFESGDELYLTNQGTSPTDDCATNTLNLAPAIKLWVFDKNKNTSSLTNPTPDYYFLDADGKLYTKNGASFRIVRSGKRNMLSVSAGNAVSMATPIVNSKLKIDNNSKVINATAVEFKEKWQTDNDVFRKYRLEYPPASGNLIVNGDFSSGNVGFTSGYTYSSTGPSIHGRINVATNPHAWNIFFAGCGDHTSGNGKMLIVDGSTVPGPTFTTVYSQTVAVLPNTDYTLSFWAQSVHSPSPAVIAVLINTSGLAPILSLTSTTCNWQQYTCNWNSGASTSANIVIRDNNNADWGNDFALDDISFGSDVCGVAPQEIPDCSGYLEKNTNPYLKGLLGTFRANQSKVFYGSRVEKNASAITNISANGFLDDFKLYWDFNIANNLVPDVANAKWVWNSQVTKLNSKGLELETKDALNIYTAAQYGFNKTTPVAIVNNSRYNEMFNEGFEDKDYSETLNNSSFNSCLRKHIDFVGLENSDIVNANDLGFNAHSGKNVLEMSANNTTTKTIEIKDPGSDNFDLTLSSVTKTFDISPTYSGNYIDFQNRPFSAMQYDYCHGGLVYTSPTYEESINNRQPSFVGVIYDPERHMNLSAGRSTTYTPGVPNSVTNGNWRCYDIVNGVEVPDLVNPITHVLHTYYKPTLSGTFHLNLGIRNFTGKVQLIIRDQENSGSPNFNTYDGVIPFIPSYDYIKSVFFDAGSPSIGCYPSYFYDAGNNEIPVDIEMCANKYYEFILIHTENVNVRNACSGTSYTLPLWRPDAVTLKYFPTGNFYSVKTVNNTYSCNYTKPIPATDDMQNPTFSLQPGKRMLFSAWVRQSCTTPCQTYANSKVDLVFNTGSPVSLAPSGPIIEGWQKIEGEFTVPVGATSMNLNFVNTSSQSIYFDDLRIHPYNANMKSYVYDPVNLRLVAELDANNYASFYEYDEEGGLIRTKAETKEGIKTITETRSAKQKNITSLQ